jgi:hypothetical protein
VYAVEKQSRMTFSRELSKLAGVKSPGESHVTSASIAGRLFFPQSKDLGTDVDENVSPALLKKTVYAGAGATSFQQASRDLDELAEAQISAARVRRATERIGNERVRERDAEVARWQEKTLPQQQRSPIDEVPEVACVQMDGGRLQVWERGTEEDEEDQGEKKSEGSGATGDRPSEKTFWRESKVGICLSMTSEVSEQDPSPDIPQTFVDPARINRLAREIKNASTKLPTTSGPNAPEAKEHHKQLDGALEVIEKEKQAIRYQAPKIVSRTVVATRQAVHVFGPILAATAWAHGFAGARRKAFLGDGSDTNWSVWRGFFSHYTPILDFVHAICYVYQAAMAGLPPEEAWSTYCQWAGWVWRGQVQLVIEALQARQKELGVPQRDDPESHPRHKIATTLGYLNNQKERMKYDQYRKNGLPITSSHIESTIKQINRRVKGTEKFWNEAGAETLLQLAADYLSTTQPLKQFWNRREEKATGQRRSYAIAV